MFVWLCVVTEIDYEWTDFMKLILTRNELKKSDS